MMQPLPPGNPDDIPHNHQHFYTRHFQKSWRSTLKSASFRAFRIVSLGTGNRLDMGLVRNLKSDYLHIYPWGKEHLLTDLLFLKSFVLRLGQFDLVPSTRYLEMPQQFNFLRVVMHKQSMFPASSIFFSSVLRTAQ